MRQDNVQRKVHGASWFFLSLICVYLCVVMILWKTNIGSHITMVQNLILSQSMIFVPTIIYILISKCDLRETLRLKKTHWLAIIIVPAFVVALEPLMTLINAISLLWVESATTELATGLVSNHKLWVSTLLMAVTPGIVEELAYRGVIMGSYRYGSRLAAIIIGGIMFGAMHMNFNQMAYAMVLGMMLGFLAEATGSIFTTMYAHFCFNEISVIISYIASHVSVLKQMVEKQGVTEQLKMQDQMKWVGLMNNIKVCAEEIVLKEIIWGIKMMADGIKIIADENGLFNIYDDTYDVIIHCESEEEQNMVMETLKKTANPWIPITERLPETDDYILISFDNFSLPDVGRYEVDENGGGAFYPGDEDVSYASVGVIVNAWMPLPKPYRQ